MQSVWVLPFVCTMLHCVHYAELFLQSHGLAHWNVMANCFFSLTAHLTRIAVDVQLLFRLSAYVTVHILYRKQSNWYWVLLIVSYYHRLLSTLQCVSFIQSLTLRALYQRVRLWTLPVFFHSEEGSTMRLRKIGTYIRKYTACYIKRQCYLVVVVMEAL